MNLYDVRWPIYLAFSPPVTLSGSFENLKSVIMRMYLLVMLSWLWTCYPIASVAALTLFSPLVSIAEIVCFWWEKRTFARNQDFFRILESLTPRQQHLRNDFHTFLIFSMSNVTLAWIMINLAASSCYWPCPRKIDKPESSCLYKQGESLKKPNMHNSRIFVNERMFCIPTHPLLVVLQKC